MVNFQKLNPDFATLLNPDWVNLMK